MYGKYGCAKPVGGLPERPGSLMMVMLRTLGEKSFRVIGLRDES